MTIRRVMSLALAAVMLLVCIPQAGAELVAPIVRSAPLERAANVQDGMVRVYLSSLGSPTSLDITVAGSYSVDGNASMSLSDGQQVSIAFNSTTGQITMTTGGTSYPMGTEMTLRRHQTSGQSGLRIAQANRPTNLYPGDMQLVARTSGDGYKLYPIVHVYIEYYLYGVVPYEMSSSWPMEALKAQSVAARTYTLNRMNGRSSYIYDLVDTSSDQVYNGYVGTETNATRAVDATKGIVIMNDGVLSGTYYTASNGGQTEAVANAWGSTSYPYLNVKDDPFDLMNTASRKKTLTVYSEFDASGQNAVLKSLLNEKLRSQLGSSASIIRIDNITPHTPKYPSPSRLYTKIDFTVTARVGSSLQQTTLTFSIFDELETQLGLSHSSSKNELWSVTNNGSSFVISITRYGHGIGMSQRGAQQMANMGYTYDQILGFYYEGCTRVQYTFSHTILPPADGGDDPIVSVEPPAIIEPSDSTQARVQLANMTDTLAIRYSANDNGTVLLTIPNGAIVTVLARSSSWTLIEFGEIIGYVPTAQLVFTGTPPTMSTQQPTRITQWATVTGSNALNLRDGPGYDYNVKTELPGGAVLAILSTNGSWVRIQYGMLVGYCASSYLTFSSSYPGNVTDSETPTAPPTPSPVQTNVPSGSAAITNTDAGMYEAASLSSDLFLLLPEGETVTIISYGSEWCHVSYYTMTGYMQTDSLTLYIDLETETPATATPTPTPTPTSTPTPTPVESYKPVQQAARVILAADLRAEPNTNSKILAVIPAGTLVTVTATGVSWSQIEYDDLSGWLLTTQLIISDEPTPTPTPTATPTPTPAPKPTEEPTTAPADGEIIGDYNENAAEDRVAWIAANASYVNLRSAASTEADVLRTLAGGTQITVLEAGGTWCRVRSGEQTGYVFSQYVTYTDPAQARGIRYVNTELDPLALRDKPTTSDSRILARMPRGSAVTLLEELGDWCCVQYDTTVGYCASRYLSTSKPADRVADDTRVLDVTLTAVEGWEAIIAAPDDSSLSPRAWCTTDAPAVFEVQNNTRVKLLEKGNIWCLISYEGEEGYCLTSNLTLIAPQN